MALTEIRSLLAWILMQVGLRCGGCGWVALGALPAVPSLKRKPARPALPVLCLHFLPRLARCCLKQCKQQPASTPLPAAPPPLITLLQLGIISHPQAEALLRFTPLARPATLDHRASRSSGVAAVVAFLKGLASLQGKVPDEATRRNRRVGVAPGVARGGAGRGTMGRGGLPGHSV